MLIDHVIRSFDSRFPRKWEEQAIAMAMESRWEEAAALNRRILSAAPQDVGALNRLGRALMEVGLYNDAREAYTSSLAVSPSNAIAEKNLARLTALQEEDGIGARSTKVDPKMFLAEPGKATTTTLKLRGKAAARAKLVVGEQVNLVISKQVLQVQDVRGELIGTVEQRLGHRIIDLMNGGNRYDAALASVEDDGARVVIRETYQDASQLGVVSFPVQEASHARGQLADGLADDDGDEEELLSDAADAPEAAEDNASGSEGDALSEQRSFPFE